MLTRRSLFLASSLALTLQASALSAGEPAGKPDTTIEVSARLVDIPGRFPADDLYDYAYVMQYQVQGGELDKQKIYVAHYKPRRARDKLDDGMKKIVGGSLKRFEVNAVHRMVLTPKMRKVWKGAVVDEYFDSDRKSKRYFCLKVDPAPEK